VAASDPHEEDLAESAYYLHQFYKNTQASPPSQGIPSLALSAHLILLIEMAKEATLCPLVQEIASLDAALSWAKRGSWAVRWVTPRLAHILMALSPLPSISGSMSRPRSRSLPRIFIYKGGAVYWFSALDSGEGSLSCEIISACGVPIDPNYASFSISCPYWYGDVRELESNLKEDYPHLSLGLGLDLDSSEGDPDAQSIGYYTNVYDESLLEAYAWALFATYRSGGLLDDESGPPDAGSREKLILSLSLRLP